MITQLATELQALAASARVSHNAYEVAVAANALALAGRDDDAISVRALLMQDRDGQVTGATASAIGSSGVSLDIETTALACLAWSHAGTRARAVDAARNLRSQYQDGRIGTTQATVLALRALLAEQPDHHATAGTVVVTVDGKSALTLRLDPQPLTNPEPLIVTLGPGTHTVDISQSDGGRQPWSLHLCGHIVRPNNDPACPLRLKTTLSRVRLPVGEPLGCTVTLTNASAAEVNAPLIIVPPAGRPRSGSRTPARPGARRTHRIQRSARRRRGALPRPLGRQRDPHHSLGADRRGAR